MIGKLCEKCFTDLMWPLWMRGLGQLRAPRKWRNCFTHAARHADIPIEIAVEVAALPALQRLLINTFRPDRSVPSATDFALAIAFELSQCDYKPFTKYPLNASQIREWAVNIRKAWLTAIIDSLVLKERFKTLRDAHPAGFIHKDAACMPYFEKLLSQKLSLQVAYFSTFTTPDATDVVRVWLPNESGLVYCDPISNESVAVAMNTAEGADRGFFRVGFDYSIDRTGDRLHVCFLDKSRTVEAGHFGGYSVGRSSNHTLWAR